ncbi:MAG: hypothetical protein KTR31_07660 [Myxococcales bacterium]|nr:hypothetical protein [Myxococcales bacterium]
MRTLISTLLLVACSGGETSSTQTSSIPTETASDLCETEGWTRRPWIAEGNTGPLRRQIAADFTVPTHRGDWTFSEHFTGCESVVFVPDSFTVSPLDDTPLVELRADVRAMVETGPRNVHYVFVTMATAGGAAPFVDSMVERIEGVLSRFSEEERAWWEPRLHISTVRADRLDDWVAEALTTGGDGFAIDRFQRVRGFGSLADVTRFDAQLDNGGFWPWQDNLAYLNHEVRYFNHESDRQDELDAIDFTTVTLYVEEDVAGTGKAHVTAELPSAATMAGFDTLWVDLTHTCDPTRVEVGNCDAWDAVQTVFLCEVDDPESCGDLELARYITTYHREGRWLADASLMLPMLREGGLQRFHLRGARFGHEVTLRLLLANTGKPSVPYAITPMWEGGSFTADYDSLHPPIELDVPADAVSAHLVVVLSGHGFGNGPNCAEFCDHQHTFTVGGSSFVAEHPNMGDQQGCLNQIEQGTVPNQSGTWWFERSSWCPGKQVDPWVFDITDQVTAGQTSTVSYATNWGATTFYGGSILMRSWVTFGK